MDKLWKKLAAIGAGILAFFAGVFLVFETVFFASFLGLVSFDKSPVFFAGFGMSLYSSGAW